MIYKPLTGATPWVGVDPSTTESSVADSFVISSSSSRSGIEIIRFLAGVI